MMEKPKSEGQPASWENLSESDRKDLDKIFSEHYLDYDVGNDLAAMSFLLMSGNFDALTPVPKYEEYVRETAGGREDKNKPETKEQADAYYDYVMQKSDLERVAKYDKLVEEFNADLERIKREKDKKAVDDFIQKGHAFLREKIEKK